MIRVLIAEDQKLLASSLITIIEKDDQITVVGCAHNGLEAVELCNTLLPDLVLMDIGMPGCDGIAATQLIKSAHNQIKVLILTMFEDDEHVQKALQNGADGYLIKDITPDELIQIIKNSCCGFGIISAKAYHNLRQHLVTCQSKGVEAEKAVVPNLSNNEIKLIQLLAEGKNNNQIAMQLYLSEGRIKNLITELLRKLGLKNRYELLSYAYKNKLIE